MDMIESESVIFCDPWNATKEAAGIDITFKYLSVISHCLAIFPILMFNSFILYALGLSDSNFSTIELMIFRSIALNDALGGLTYAIIVSLREFKVVISVSLEVCQIAMSGIIFSYLCSAFLLLLLTLNKYLQVTQPLRYRIYLTKRRVKVYLIGAALITAMEATILLPIKGLPFGGVGASSACLNLKHFTLSQTLVLVVDIATLLCTAVSLAALNCHLCFFAFKHLKLARKMHLALYHVHGGVEHEHARRSSDVSSEDGESSNNVSYGYANSTINDDDEDSQLVTNDSNDNNQRANDVVHEEGCQSKRVSDADRGTDQDVNDLGNNYGGKTDIGNQGAQRTNNVNVHASLTNSVANENEQQTEHVGNYNDRVNDVGNEETWSMNIIVINNDEPCTGNINNYNNRGSDGENNKKRLLNIVHNNKQCESKINIGDARGNSILGNHLERSENVTNNEEERRVTVDIARSFHARRAKWKGVKTVIITTFTSFVAAALPTMMLFLAPRLGDSFVTLMLVWLIVTMNLGTRWWKIFIFNATDVRFRKASKRALRHLKRKFESGSSCNSLPQAF